MKKETPAKEKPVIDYEELDSASDSSGDTQEPAAEDSYEEEATAPEKDMAPHDFSYDDHESEDTVDSAEFYEDKDVYEDDDSYEDDHYYSYSEESREKAARSRKRRAGLVLAEKTILTVLAALLLAAAVIYVGGCVYFGSHFGFRTTLNGREISCKDTEAVEQLLLSSASSYSLTITGRGVTDQITAQEVSLTPSFEGSLGTILQAQSRFEWPVTLFVPTELTLPHTASFDSNALETRIDQLAFFDSANETEPVDASYTFQDGSFQIVPENPGSVPIRSAVLETVRTALEEYRTEVELGDDCYEKASITSEDSALQNTVAELNQMIDDEVTIAFGDETETLSGEDLAGMLLTSGDTLSFDPEKVSAYVSTLAEKYDTVGKDREFKTTGGSTVTVSGGNYGWKMDQAATSEALLSFLNEGTGGAFEPAWTREAAQHGEDDIGSSYAEVDLDDQHVYLYINGECVVSTDCVSGKAIDSGRFTPDGTYYLLYRKSPAVLKGEDYESPVTYWMPFNGGIGFHDASWRSRFGGEIYLTAGSHGCINLPTSAAKKLYENIYSGIAVVVYGGMKPEEAIKYTGQKPAPSTKKDTSEEEDSSAADSSEQADQNAANAAASAAAQQQQAAVIAQAVQNYMAQGMSQEEANAKVQADLAAQLAAQQAAAQGQE